MITRRARRGWRDLLHRRPALSDRPPSPGREPTAQVRRQLEELEDLYRRGFLSQREFEAQRRKVLDG